MKLTTIFKCLAPFAISLAKATELDFLVTTEILNHVTTIEQSIELLRTLSLEHPTLETVSPKDIIIAVVKITGEPFSSEIYDHYEIDPETDLPEALASPRFGVSQGAMNSLDPNGFILGYGCRCRFGSGQPKGKGKAVDDLDKLCKSVQQSYECLKMDIFADDDKFCDPRTVAYGYDLTNYVLTSLNLPGPSFADNCNTHNIGDRCAAQTCLLELTLVHEFSRGKLANTIVTDAQYIHDSYGGAFNVTECVPIVNPNIALALGNGGNSNGAGWSGGSAPEKECCGTFPKRFPFNTLGGIRECCNDRTYNTAIASCCSGVINAGGCVP